MRRSIFSLLVLSVGLLLSVSCTQRVTPEDTGDPVSYYANLFAFNNMSAYYLWADEVADGLQSWTYGDKPVEKVASLRFRDANGKLVDQWTTLMEDCSSFVNSVTGNGKTFGLEFILLRSGENGVVMEVTYTYADSPARNAGLRRGDIILSVDGQALTLDNYANLLTEKIYNFPGTITLGLREGGRVKMSAVEMYCDPVHVVKTLDLGDRKLGYLHFTSFTWEACQTLVEAMGQLKADGIDEMVLDLRYNTGGYSKTAQVLGSLLAPPSAVQEGAVFNKEFYNALLTPTMGSEAHFAGSFTLEGISGPLNTLEANPGVSRLWVIVTGHSASASEALICGLAPYMDVVLVGSNTTGKFCGGHLIQAEHWFTDLAKEETDIDCAAGKIATAGWGLYVISYRYADCNGVTRSMPSGIPADFPATDDPSDGFELGDPSESMLSVVLAHAMGAPTAAPAVKAPFERQELPYAKPGAGVLIY